MADKPTAPEYWAGKPQEHTRKVAQVVNQMLQGYTNNSLKVTLDDTEATTEVIRTKATSLQHANLSPISEAAAADFALGTTWAVVEEGKVVIHHAAGVAGREYGIVLQG